MLIAKSVVNNARRESNMYRYVIKLSDGSDFIIYQDSPLTKEALEALRQWAEGE
jgi:hypothetical protein